jgi:putative ABC transport system substrate-binding protein
MTFAAGHESGLGTKRRLGNVRFCAACGDRADIRQTGRDRRDATTDGGDQLKRRQFITLIGGAAAWPLAAHAQQSAMPVIGFLSSRSPGESTGVVAAFREGLRETGFVEGRNLAIAFRWAEGHYDRLPVLAAELVRLPVALLFAAGGSPTAFAARSATSTIPIVFSAVGDPVENGLVSSLNAPGGNITGMAAFVSALGQKQIELAKELIPSVGVIGYLLNPSNPRSEIESRGALTAARTLGIELRIISASLETELDAALTAVKAGVDALIVAADPFFDSRRDRIVALASRHGVPGLYAWREYVLAGGLMSYGTDLPDSYRQAAMYAGRILKGEKPANLPVMQPTKFHLAINLKTATTLGISVPPTLLARADEVIE